METYNVATIKIVYGALFEDEEFPGLEKAVTIIKARRIDYHELFTYAKVISKNEVNPYYKKLCAQMRNVIVERDTIRSPFRMGLGHAKI